MLKLIKLILIVALWTPVAVQAQTYTTPPKIDQKYQIPDRSGEAALLLKKIKLLHQRSRALAKGGQADRSVDDLISDLYLPDNVRDFNRTYSQEIDLARNPKNAHSWFSLSRNYSRRGQYEDAATAAFKAYQLEKNSRQRAEIIAHMGEVYVELGQLEDGLNILHRSLELSPGDNIQRRITVIKERFFLTISDISVNVEQASPNACIVFSKALKHGQKAEDYVAVTGHKDLDITAKGTQICINGLNYGETYEVTIRKGLKGVEKTILDQDSIRKFTVQDRAPRTSFSQNSYVVSRTRDNVLPVTTVNVDSLELSLYLIPDRNLIHGTQRDFFTRLNQYSTNRISNEEGSLIWQGSVDITGGRNREINTLLPLDDMITDKQNGLYALVATMPGKKDEPEWRLRSRQKATQWLLVSDMGLMTFKGKDGLHVMVRSLESAKPLRKATVTLVARNNKILGTAKSDAQGLAHFPAGLVRGKGGDAPALISAETKTKDYNFLKLDTGYLDLSNRGVGGRSAPGEQDAFLYTDRGVYRPGETVKISALLRDPDSKALGALPLTFKVVKPDGAVLMEKVFTGDALGGYGFDIAIASAAIPGRYTVTSYLADETHALGMVSFQVEDFVPQRIRATLKTDADWIETGTQTEFLLQANFLYGPPASDLKSETRVQINRNPRPYPNYKDFSFGLIQDDFYAKTLPPITRTTNKDGRASLALDLKDLPDTSQPLLVYLQSFVFDVSGRPVDAKSAIPLRLRDVEVGLKKSFTGNLSDGDTATFDVIALDRKGQPVKNRTLAYELIKEDYYYSWYRQGDYWNSRQQVTDTMVTTGEIITDEAGRAAVSHPAADGRYRLQIRDQKGDSAASLRYYVGWWSSGSVPNVPDELELSLKDKTTRSGEKITAFIKAPFAGKLTVMVMNDQLRHSKEYDLPKEGRQIDIKVDNGWGPGAYLMATAFRPDAGEVSLLPVRAMGLAWFSIDQVKRKTRVSIEVPDSVLPRQTVTLPLQLDGEAVKGQKVRLTVAAVDEGILGLTNFSSPDPIAHFLSQRRLGMALADLYGRLIKPLDGVRGKLRTGGDMAKMMSAGFSEVADAREPDASDEKAQGVQTKTVKTVALYQRDIQIDETGRGEITLELPDFNGRLRLMAVAYGENIVGQGDQELIVRDPVVADILLPRFLSPGDQAETTLSLHNLSGKDRTFTIDLSHATGLSLKGDKRRAITLAHGQRFEQIISLKADSTGDSKVALTVTSDGLPTIQREWDIAVRPAQPFVTKRAVAYLGQGDHGMISHEDITGALPGTLSAMLTLTDTPDYNVPDLLDSLYLYPYACGEQTTSRALPLLYYGDVAGKWNKEYDPLTMRRVIDKAIRHLLHLQKHDGSFALWRSTGDTHPWLTAYVFEFLSRAKEQNMEVPTAAYDHARSWLMNYSNQRSSRDPHVMAYVQYVLARIGDIQPSVVRYFADNHGRSIETKLGYGHLAAALKLVGETQASEEYFQRALTTFRPEGIQWRWYHDFGSNMRDSATLAALIAESAPNSERAQRVIEALDKAFDQRAYFSTQEQAWLLLATHSLSQNGGDLHLAINGKALPIRPAPLRYSLKPEAIRHGFDVENRGPQTIRAIQSIRAVPDAPLPPVANGFEINRTFLTLDGKPVDLANIRQNDMLLVVIEGRSVNKIDHEALIVDLLPAGFEIENAAIGGFEGGKDMDFLPAKTNFLYEAARDDRYVAALNLGNYARKFATSYIVRAVTPGVYQLPAVFVEDMYKPQYHARGDVGQVTIRK